MVILKNEVPMGMLEAPLDGVTAEKIGAEFPPAEPYTGGIYSPAAVLLSL